MVDDLGVMVLDHGLMVIVHEPMVIDLGVMVIVHDLMVILHDLVVILHELMVIDLGTMLVDHELMVVDVGVMVIDLGVMVIDIDTMYVNDTIHDSAVIVSERDAADESVASHGDLRKLLRQVPVTSDALRSRAWNALWRFRHRRSPPACPVDPAIEAFCEGWAREVDRVLPAGGVALFHSLGVGPNVLLRYKRLLMSDGRLFHAHLGAHSAADTPFPRRPSATLDAEWMERFHATARGENLFAMPPVQHVPMMDGGYDVLLLRVDGRVCERVFYGVSCATAGMLEGGRVGGHLVPHHASRH